MSNRAVTWAYKQTAIKGGRKFVLVTLADMADSEHSCFPGVKLLAELTGISEAAVREHLVQLAALRLLSAERRHRKDGARTSNRYYLDVDGALQNQAPESGGSESDDLAPDSGAPSARKPMDLAPDSGGAIRTSLNPQKNHQENPQLYPQTPATLDIVPADPSIDDLFDEFWTVWPRKEAKKTARKSYDRALAAARRGLGPGAPLDQVAGLIYSAVIRWSQQWLEVERRTPDKIPHPSTWLNGERWNDQLPTRQPNAAIAGRPLTKREQNLAYLHQVKQREQLTQLEPKGINA